MATIPQAVKNAARLMPKGSRMFSGYHVLKNDSMTAIAKRDRRPNDFYVVVFPNSREDVKALKKTMQRNVIMGGGYADENPDAVGTMRFWVTDEYAYTPEAKRRLKLPKTVFHFKEDQTHYCLEGVKRNPVTPEFHKKYGWNWRRLAFELAIIEARKNNAALAFDRYPHAGPTSAFRPYSQPGTDFDAGRPAPHRTTRDWFYEQLEQAVKARPESVDKFVSMIRRTKPGTPSALLITPKRKR